MTEPGRFSHSLAWFLGLLVLACAQPAPEPAPDDASLSVEAGDPIAGPPATVTILTTNAADVAGSSGAVPLQGEWSFAAWIEVGERRFLFDTGWSPGNVLHNAEALGIDLSTAEDLILSHNHGDHTGGVLLLREELSKKNPKALSRIHVARGIFASRPRGDGGEGNPMVAKKEQIEATGAEFLIYDEPTEIAPGVWLTGPVERTHAEKTYPSSSGFVVVQNGETVPDTIPESQSLVVLAEGGPVVVSGCGHAGLINTLEQSRRTISPHDPQAAIGGFHLFGASDEDLEWTAEQLVEQGLGHLLGSHCTGLEAVYRMRAAADMNRDTARVGAIGTRFVAGQGIEPGQINR